MNLPILHGLREALINANIITPPEGVVASAAERERQLREEAERYERAAQEGAAKMSPSEPAAAEEPTNLSAGNRAVPEYVIDPEWEGRPLRGIKELKDKVGFLYRAYGDTLQTAIGTQEGRHFVSTLNVLTEKLGEIEKKNPTESDVATLAREADDIEKEIRLFRAKKYGEVVEREHRRLGNVLEAIEKEYRVFIEGESENGGGAALSLTPLAEGEAPPRTSNFIDAYNTLYTVWDNAREGVADIRKLEHATEEAGRFREKVAYAKELYEGLRTIKEAHGRFLTRSRDRDGALAHEYEEFLRAYKTLDGGVRGVVLTRLVDFDTRVQEAEAREWETRSEIQAPEVFQEVVPQSPLLDGGEGSGKELVARSSSPLTTSPRDGGNVATTGGASPGRGTYPQEPIRLVPMSDDEGLPPPRQQDKIEGNRHAGTLQIEGGETMRPVIALRPEDLPAISTSEPRGALSDDRLETLKIEHTSKGASIPSIALQPEAMRALPSTSGEPTLLVTNVSGSGSERIEHTPRKALEGHNRQDGRETTSRVTVADAIARLTALQREVRGRVAAE